MSQESESNPEQYIILLTCLNQMNISQESKSP